MTGIEMVIVKNMWPVRVPIFADVILELLTLLRFSF